MSRQARCRQRERSAAPARTPGSGCWPGCRSRSDGCSWPASPPPCWRAVTARRSSCCTAGEFAARVAAGDRRSWCRRHRVIAPDLPGHRRLGDVRRRADTERVLAWLGELIERDLPVAAGAGRARARRRHRGPFRGRPGRPARSAGAGGHARAGPVPAGAEVRARLASASVMRPTERGRRRLLAQCFVDLDGLRDQMGERWDGSRRTPSTVPHAGPEGRAPQSHAAARVPAIPSGDLARIAVPTTLIWGRHDLGCG